MSGISILRYLNVHVEIFRALEMVACFMLQKNKWMKMKYGVYFYPLIFWNYSVCTGTYFYLMYHHSNSIAGLSVIQTMIVVMVLMKENSVVSLLEIWYVSFIIMDVFHMYFSSKWSCLILWEYECIRLIGIYAKDKKML